MELELTDLSRVEDIPGYAEVLKFATEAHKGALRKHLGTPYIEHPIAVSRMIFEYLKDDCQPVENIIAGTKAGLLHDVVEDTKYTLEDVESRFGESVGNIVYYTTDPVHEEGKDRADRKMINNLHLRNGDVISKTLKCCDCMHNIRDMLISNPGFARKYTLEKEECLFSALSDAAVQARKDLTNTIRNVLFYYQLPKSAMKILEGAKYLHPIDAIEASRKPKFKSPDKYTWQNYVDKSVRNMWDELSWDARIYIMTKAYSEYMRG